MKNLTFSAAFAIIAIFSISKQANAQSDGVHLGVKAGLNLSTLGSAKSGGYTINYKYRPGLQVGLFLNAPVAKDVSFNPQVLYTQKGGNINTEINGVKVNAGTQLNYIDVPLLFGFKASPNLTFYGGPQVSFLLSQKTSVTAPGRGTQTETDKSRSNNNVVGGNVGAGYHLGNGVGINLHYMFDLQKAEQKQFTTGERNSGFALTLSVRFQ